MDCPTAQTIYRFAQQHFTTNGINLFGRHRRTPSVNYIPGYEGLLQLGLQAMQLLSPAQQEHLIVILSLLLRVLLGFFSYSGWLAVSDRLAAVVWS